MSSSGRFRGDAYNNVSGPYTNAQKSVQPPGLPRFAGDRFGRGELPVVKTSHPCGARCSPHQNLLLPAAASLSGVPSPQCFVLQCFQDLGEFVFCGV